MYNCYGDIRVEFRFQAFEECGHTGEKPEKLWWLLVRSYHFFYVYILIRKALQTNSILAKMDNFSSPPIDVFAMSVNQNIN